MGATIYLLILIAAFIGIVVWVFGRKRKARLCKGRPYPSRRWEGLSTVVSDQMKLATVRSYLKSRLQNATAGDDNGALEARCLQK